MGEEVGVGDKVGALAGVGAGGDVGEAVERGALVGSGEEGVRDTDAGCIVPGSVVVASGLQATSQRESVIRILKQRGAFMTVMIH